MHTAIAEANARPGQHGLGNSFLPLRLVPHTLQAVTGLWLVGTLQEQVSCTARASRPKAHQILHVRLRAYQHAAKNRTAMGCCLEEHQILRGQL